MDARSRPPTDSLPEIQAADPTDRDRLTGSAIYGEPIPESGARRARARPGPRDGGLQRELAIHRADEGQEHDGARVRAPGRDPALPLAARERVLRDRQRADGADQPAAVGAPRADVVADAPGQGHDPRAGPRHRHRYDGRRRQDVDLHAAAGPEVLRRQPDHRAGREVRHRAVVRADVPGWPRLPQDAAGRRHQLRRPVRRQEARLHRGRRRPQDRLPPDASVRQLAVDRQHASLRAGAGRGRHQAGDVRRAPGRQRPVPGDELPQGLAGGAGPQPELEGRHRPGTVRRP